MGLVLLVGIGALLLGLLAGGRPGSAASRLRALRLLLVAALVQLLAALVADGAGAPYAAALAVSAVFAGGFVLANVHVPGVALVGLGLVLNAAVVGLNGGAMPVSAPAAARAGVDATRFPLPAAGPDDAGGRHSASADDTRLGFLGDVIPVPSPLRAEVVSAGDVLVAAGVGLLVLTGMSTGGPRRRQGREGRASTLASDSTTRGSYS